MSLVFGAAGTRSSIVYPLPAVYVAPLAVITAPSARLPAAVVPFPLFAAVPFPWAAAVDVTSKELAVAKPEYSKMAKRKVLLEIDSDTVTVFAPPAIFSA
jgi:hypothetical protein